MEYGKPLLVIALEQLGLLEKWRYVSGGGIYVELREGFHVKSFVNLREPAGGLSMDMKDHFIAGLQVLSRKEMREEGVKLYRRLKGLEATLEYKGILRNKPVFISRPVLKLISPSIVVNEALVDKLNGDERLIRLIKQIKPSAFRIVLKSVNEYLASQDRNLLEMEREYFEEPSEVAWILVVSAILPRGPGYKKKVLGIVEMLDRAARHVMDITVRERERVDC